MKKKLHLFFCCIWLCIYAEAQLIKDNHNITSQNLNIHLNSYINSNVNPARQILLVHGLTYSSHEFHVDYKDYSLVKFLIGKGYKVWSLDIAGYGQSDKPTDGFLISTAYAAINIANAVNFIINKESLKQIDLLGWSWGTATSSKFVAGHAELIRKLILYAPITSGYDGEQPENDWHVNTWEHAASDFQLKNKEIDTSIMESNVMHIFLSNSWRFDKDSSPNGGRKDLLQGNDVSLINAAQLRLPVLFIGGDHDPYLRWNEIEQMHKDHSQIFNSQLIQIKGGGHALMIEKPFYKAFQNHIWEFLKAD